MNILRSDVLWGRRLVNNRRLLFYARKSGYVATYGNKWALYATVEQLLRTNLSAETMTARPSTLISWIRWVTIENRVVSKALQGSDRFRTDWKPCRVYFLRFFPKIFRPYLDIRGFTRLDLFTSTCFCLSWCVAASVILGANGFWLRSIYFDAVQDHRLLCSCNSIPVPVDWGGKPRYNKRNDLFTAAGHEENKLWK